MTLDAELVLRARNGDSEAFAAIYDSIRDDLYRYALYTLGNQEEAEDAVSEAFMEAWKGISHLRQPEAFKGWMFRIVSIRCKRHIGENIRKRNQVDIDDLAGVFAASGSETEITERLALAEALSSISEEERMLVLLSALYGYTVQEIAGIVNKPQGTVSSKLCRTYAKLRKKLEER